MDLHSVDSKTDVHRWVEQRVRAAAGRVSVKDVVTTMVTGKVPTPCTVCELSAALGKPHKVVEWAVGRAFTCGFLDSPKPNYYAVRLKENRPPFIGPQDIRYTLKKHGPMTLLEMADVLVTSRELLLAPLMDLVDLGAVVFGVFDKSGGVGFFYLVNQLAPRGIELLQRTPKRRRTV